MAVSMKTVLETTSVQPAESASSWRRAKAGGPARACVSWDRGTKRPVPVRPRLSRFIASLASVNAPVDKAAAATAKDASGCVTNTSTTTW